MFDFPSPEHDATKQGKSKMSACFKPLQVRYIQNICVGLLFIIIKLKLYNTLTFHKKGLHNTLLFCFWLGEMALSNLLMLVGSGKITNVGKDGTQGNIAIGYFC